MEIEIHKSQSTPFILDNEPIKNLTQIILTLDLQTDINNVEVFTSGHLLFNEDTKKWEQRIRLDKHQLLDWKHKWFIYPHYNHIDYIFNYNSEKLQVHVITNSEDNLTSGQRITFTMEHKHNNVQYIKLPIFLPDQENDEGILDNIYKYVDNEPHHLSPRTLDMLENGQIERPILSRSTNNLLDE
jgi:hypothetical protein